MPVGSDVSAFEDSLVSVLENQPAGSEILVAHDGSYDDPFNLTDEVRFITGQTDQLVDLVASATRQARSRFVHVLAPGFRATSGWIDAALQQFERQDVAAVAPVIRRADSEKIAAAGWGDHGGRLFHPIASGATHVDRGDASHVLGAYLQASFWRREVLSSMAAAFQSRCTSEATYAYGRLLAAGQWRCALAADSVVRQTHDVLAEPANYSRGQRLWAIKKAIDPTTRKVPWSKLLTAILRPGFTETIGQVNGPKMLAEMKSRLQIERAVSSSDHGTIIKLPPKSANKRRRAA